MKNTKLAIFALTPIVLGLLASCGGNKTNDRGNASYEQALEFVGKFGEVEDSIAKYSDVTFNLDSLAANGEVTLLSNTFKLNFDAGSQKNQKVKISNNRGVKNSLGFYTNYEKTGINSLFSPCIDDEDLKTFKQIENIFDAEHPNENIIVPYRNIDDNKLKIGIKITNLKIFTDWYQSLPQETSRWLDFPVTEGEGTFAFYIEVTNKGYLTNLTYEFDCKGISLSLNVAMISGAFKGDAKGSFSLNNKVTFYDEKEYVHVSFLEAKDGKFLETFDYKHRSFTDEEVKTYLGEEYSSYEKDLYENFYKNIKDYYDVILPGFGTYIVIDQSKSENKIKSEDDIFILEDDLVTRKLSEYTYKTYDYDGKEIENEAIVCDFNSGILPDDCFVIFIDENMKDLVKSDFKIVLNHE